MLCYKNIYLVASKGLSLSPAGYLGLKQLNLGFGVHFFLKNTVNFQ